ncbi:MAG: lipase family protein [Myxococcaceae bacterium]
MRRLLLILTLAACGGKPVMVVVPPVDSGTPGDAGHHEEPDAGPADSGQPEQDSGTPDAGPVDSGTPDAGPLHADRPALPCTDNPSTLWDDPASALSTNPAARGDILRCAHETDQSATEIGLSMPQVMNPSGTHRYFVEYATTLGNGQPGFSSARVWLPDTPRATPMPVVVIAHPSLGLADTVAPSKNTPSNTDQALYWVSRGYAVMAPDYPGLGTSGVQGYVDNRETGQALLDAARALKKLMDPRVFDGRVAMLGYSQGGGGVLSAQALDHSYGDGNLAVVAALAPEWPTRLNSFGFVDMMNAPSTFSFQFGYTKPVVATQMMYGYFHNYLGSTAGFPSGSASDIVNSLETLSLVPYGGWLEATELHVSDWVDDTLRTQFLACESDPLSSGCTGNGKLLWYWMQQNLLTPDANGAKVLYVQGMLDTVMVPTEEAACNLPYLKQFGADVTFCADGTATHTDVVPRNADFAVRWAEAQLWGTSVPQCTDATLAPCP